VAEDRFPAGQAAGFFYPAGRLRVGPVRKSRAPREVTLRYRPSIYSHPLELSDRCRHRPPVEMAAACRARYPRYGSPPAGVPAARSRAVAPGDRLISIAQGAQLDSLAQVPELRAPEAPQRCLFQITLGRAAAVKFGQLFIHPLNDDTGFLDRRPQHEGSQTRAVAVVLTLRDCAACCIIAGRLPAAYWSDS
jgi:hypothetical protein